MISFVMKKKLIMILALVTMFCFGACASSTASAEQTAPLQIWAQNQNGCYETMCVIDKDTGVNYVVVVGGSGNHDTVAITPRLNKDGSLYTSK
jgi:ABC-type glycerol-3-phosphate transport system substrate-binding protein